MNESIEQKNNKQRNVGIILQYLQMGLSLLVQFFYIPIMLRFLTVTEYGLYSLALSTMSFLSLFSLGVGSSYIRYKSMAENNLLNHSSSDLNGYYLLFYLICGILSFAVGMVLSLNVSIFFNESYLESDIQMFRIIFIIMVINVSLSFPGSLFPSYIMAEEKHIFQKCLNMVSTVLTPIVCILVLFLGYKSIAMAIASLLLSVVVHLLNIVFCFVKLKMKITFSRPDSQLFKDVGLFSLFIAINQIVNQINWQADKVMLAKMLNASSVAIYSIASQIAAFFRTFATPVTSAYVPKINLIVAQNNPDKAEELNSLQMKVGKFQWYILSFIFSGFIFFGQRFIGLWAGSDYSYSYYLCLILMGPLLLNLCQGVATEIQISMNMHRISSLIYLAASLINVALSVLLIHYIGVIGAPIGTAVSIIVTDGIILNVYYKRKLGLNMDKFWFDILKTLRWMCVPIICGTCLYLFVDQNSLLIYVLLIAFYSLFYWITFFFIELKKEKRSEIIRKIFKRKS